MRTSYLHWFPLHLKSYEAIYWSPNIYLHSDYIIGQRLDFRKFKYFIMNNKHACLLWKETHYLPTLFAIQASLYMFLFARCAEIWKICWDCLPTLSNPCFYTILRLEHFFYDYTTLLGTIVNQMDRVWCRIFQQSHLTFN